MSSREQEIFKIINENPMISQNEIAEMLGITRSSVSVYITSLMKKGFIKGRGYVVSEDTYPVIIGAVNVDLIGIMNNAQETKEDDAILQDENEISVTYGGVAKNIAENLVRLGERPKIISAISSDIFGTEIVRECNERGISTEASLFLDHMPSSMYLEIRDQKKLSLTGLANVAIEEQITPEFLESKYAFINRANQIVLEDGLTREAVEYITTRHKKAQKYMVSTRHIFRMGKYAHIMERFKMVQLSYKPAVAIAGFGDMNVLDDESSIREVMKRILDKGANEILVPFSFNKIAYANQQRILLYTLPQEKTWSKIYSYFRDAMMAGVMYCDARNKPPEEMLPFIAACAEVALKNNLPDYLNMSIEEVEKVLKRHRKDYLMAL